MPQEPFSPRDPSRVSPTSDIYLSDGEDRASSPLPLQHGCPAGARPRGAVAGRPPRVHAQHPAAVRPSCQAPSPARGGARGGPAQPSVAPPGPLGTRKSCWKRTSLSRLGTQAPAPRLAFASSPPPPRKAAKPSGGSWDGSRGVSRYELGMKWGDLGCLDTRDPFLALGRPLGLEPSDGACLRVWVSARPEHRPVELQTACGAEHHPTGSPMGPRITPHSILWGQASPHGQPCEAEYHPTSSPMGLNITSRSILWGQASPHKQSGHPTGSVLQP